jgi:hypothetical protein
MPEVANNIDSTTGTLGLTDKEEDQIVAFLETLSDGFTRPYANVDTFTGTCMKGGSAATQGNEMLIPTPTLPPCASAICSVEPLPGPKAIADSSGSRSRQQDATKPSAARARIIEGPQIELATEYLTIIRWNTRNPGGSPVHYGVVHYGMRPDRLVEAAESPIRLNPNHQTTLFRVRLNNLKKGTTYYYKVDSRGPDGVSEGVFSSVKSFAIH